jgi:hypothetical protein
LVHTLVALVVPRRLGIFFNFGLWLSLVERLVREEFQRFFD